jgi:hypothetical protein
MSCILTVAAVPPVAPLWVMLELRVGRVPALIDTGAQFSCVRSDVAEYFYLTCEPCTFTRCPVTFSLADGRRCEVTDPVNLNVNLLSFSWDHDFIVL